VSEKLRTSGTGDILIDSDWITTIGMALLFALIVFLLGWSIRDFLFNKVDHEVLQHVRRGWLDALTNPIGVVYCFLFAYSFPAKHLKIAFLLLGTKYLALIAVSYLHTGADVRQCASIAGAIASQIAYAIILIAIAQWFKTVVRRDRPTEPEVSDS